MKYQTIKPWALPPHYAGAIWPDYYSAGVGQSRDSSTLERSNFASMLAALGGESDTVQVVREGHFLVGWIEWIAIHQNDHAALAVADRLATNLQNHPVIDEDHWAALEWNTATESWARATVADRVAALQRHCPRVSVFAARRAELPSVDSGALVSYLADGC